MCGGSPGVGGGEMLGGGFSMRESSVYVGDVVGDGLVEVVGYKACVDIVG